MKHLNKFNESKDENIILELTKEEAISLMRCIMLTNASGKDLDVGEMIENKIQEYLTSKSK